MNKQTKLFLYSLLLASGLTVIHYTSHRLVSLTPFYNHPIAFVVSVVFIVSFVSLVGFLHQLFSWQFRF